MIYERTLFTNGLISQSHKLQVKAARDFNIHAVLQVSEICLTLMDSPKQNGGKTFNNFIEVELRLTPLLNGSGSN